MPRIEERTYPTEAPWFIGDARETTHRASDENWSLRHAALESSLRSAWNDEIQTVDAWLLTKSPLAWSNCATLPEGRRHRPGFIAAVSKIDPRTDLLRPEFDALSMKWQHETKHLSLVSKKIVHPAYLRIIGMGEAVVPLLLESLRQSPTHWFAALRATSNCDPASPEDTPSEAREAWIRWGLTKGLIY